MKARVRWSGVKLNTNEGCWDIPPLGQLHRWAGSRLRAGFWAARGTQTLALHHPVSPSPCSLRSKHISPLTTSLGVRASLLPNVSLGSMGMPQHNI